MMDWTDDRELAIAAGRTMRAWRTEQRLTLDRVAVAYQSATGRACDPPRVLAVEKGKHALTLSGLSGWAMTWSELRGRDVTPADFFDSDAPGVAAMLRGGPVPALIGSVAPLQISQTDRDVARRLGVEPEQVYITSFNLWDRTFADERDRRAGEGASPQRRGFEGRAMQAEIAERIAELDW